MHLLELFSIIRDVKLSDTLPPFRRFIVGETLWHLGFPGLRAGFTWRVAQQIPCSGNARAAGCVQRRRLSLYCSYALGGKSQSFARNLRPEARIRIIQGFRTYATRADPSQLDDYGMVGLIGLPRLLRAGSYGT